MIGSLRLCKLLRALGPGWGGNRKVGLVGLGRGVREYERGLGCVGLSLGSRVCP